LRDGVAQAIDAAELSTPVAAVGRINAESENATVTRFKNILKT